ncbi:MAG: MBL fold metallo-hydrolase [Acidobacteriota bacterium]
MRINRPFFEIAENIFVLQENMFPLYLIKGEKNFLIDSSISAYGESIGKKLKELPGEEKVQNIMLTHSHYDHTGALPYLQKLFEPDIYGSERTIELLEREDVRNFIKDMNNRFNEVLGTGRTDEFPMLKNLKKLKNGDRIKIDNSRFMEVVSTPGHTKCSISFFLHPDKILFPGDATGVIERNNKPKPLFLSDYDQYVNSIKGLMELDAEMICLPHNNYIKGAERVKKHIQNSLESAVDLKEKIESALNSGLDVESVSRQIMESEFPQPTVQGPEEAFNINLHSMVRAVKKLQ